MPPSSDPSRNHATARAAAREAEPRPPVRVVHAAVKGRARLQVNGLYRCEPARLRLESELAHRSGIKQVSANILTGKLLILFDPVQHIEEIKNQVEQIVSRLASTPASGARGSTAIGDHFLHPSPQTAAPAFGALGQDRNDWHLLP